MSGPGALPDAAALPAGDLAGQLVCVVLRDYAGEPAAREAFLADFERHGWGGVIVFGGRLGAVSELLAEARSRSAVPPLVVGDFERGFGQQFPEGGTVFPPLMALGAAGDPALARAVAVAVGRELRDHGFHVNFAPVADLASEPANPIVATRAAGDDPRAVAAVVGAFVEGSQSAGVAATVKHFPGHGRTLLDSHAVLPVVTASRPELEAADWVPFRAGLDAGARLVMSAHVAFPALEPDRAADRPATFSRAIMTDLLRREWGFEGLVCSDALMMGAVTGEAPDEAARRSLAAGVDWLLYPPDPPRVHAGLVRGLADGSIDRERCEAAVRRLIDLKRWAGLAAGAGAAPAAGGVSLASALPLAEAVAGAALTARPAEPPEGSAWPDRAQWVVVLDGAITPGDIVLGKELAPEAADRIVLIDTTGEPAAVRAAIEEAGRRCARAWAACAVFSPVRAWKGRAGLSEAGRRAVAAACGSAREAVLLIFSNPHIVREVQPPSRVVWTFGEDAASQRAAVAFLRGALPAAGRLPVQIDTMPHDGR